MSPRPRIGITTKSGGSTHPAYRLYAVAVEAAGGEPVWLEPEVLAGTDPQAILRDLDGLLFSGGVDIDPTEFGEAVVPDAGVEIDLERDAAELPLARAALATDIPVFGICRGVQTLAVAGGGSLHQDLSVLGHALARHQQRKAGKDERANAHGVDVEPGTILARAVGEGTQEVNSFHHQAVRDLPAGFVVTARSTDGVVEAVEDPRRAFTLGVQWHPERMVDRDPAQRKLFAAFVEAARSRLLARR
ncbi:MAG TPA: gamma-glutamyl-gamma-aminobutyrate hydrolase family protein [bacterium]